MLLQMRYIIFHQKAERHRFTIANSHGVGKFLFRDVRHHMQQMLIIAFPKRQQLIPGFSLIIL